MLAVADGPELLVYDPDGRPVWKHFCDSIIVGVASSPTEMLVLDAEGTLLRFRAMDGVEVDRGSVGRAGGLSRTGNGAVIVWDRNGVSFLANSASPPRDVVVAQVLAAEVGPDGASVGVALQGGRFQVVDPVSGTAWGECALPADGHGVGWSRLGFWVVSAGHHLCLVSGDGTEVVAAIPGATARLGEVSVSGSGVMAAVCLGRNAAMVFDLHGRTVAGQVDFRREVGSVSFGRANTLAIGLDDGDVTLMDVTTGGSHRTEPHAGRGRNNWNIEDRLDREKLRGAAAFSAAGGVPIAKYEGPPPEKTSYWLTCLVIFLVVSLMCAGCGGLGGAYWYFFA